MRNFIFPKIRQVGSIPREESSNHLPGGYRPKCRWEKKTGGMFSI